MTEDEDKLEEFADCEEIYSPFWDVIFFLVFFVFFIFPYVSFGAEDQGERLVLKVSDKAVVTSDVVRLGDIAEIKGPEELTSRIAGLAVTPSPRPGRSKNIIKSRIEALLKSGFKGWPDADLDIPDLMVVTRDSQKVPGEELRNLFEKRLKELSLKETTEISDFRIRGKNLFSSGPLDLKPVFDSQGIRMGRLSIPVDVLISGKKEGRLTLSAKVGLFSNVVCAARDIPRGTVLTEADLKIESRSIRSGVTGDILSDLSAATGKKVKSSIRSGGVIPEKLLEAPSVLRKGDRVRLVARSGMLSVETVAEASSDAALGESVMVRNIDSGKMVTARVVDSATVEAVF